MGEVGERWVVRQHLDFVLCDGYLTLEQQILEGALQPGHLLGQSLAAIVLRRTLGLGHVVQQIHRAQRRGKNQQYQRYRDLERRRLCPAQAVDLRVLSVDAVARDLPDIVTAASWSGPTG